jgi:hypothetical protein
MLADDERAGLVAHLPALQAAKRKEGPAEAVNRLPPGPKVPAIEPLRIGANGPHGAPVVRKMGSTDELARHRQKSSSVAGPLIEALVGR